jgi:hypothetical protein
VTPDAEKTRRVWPLRTAPTTTPAGTHSHPLPAVMRLSLAGLVVAVLLQCAAITVLAIYVVQDHNYVIGRGELRDRETVALKEQIRQSICDLLDQLPEGGLLDRPRNKYGCGPGIPLSEFPQGWQDKIRSQQPDEPATTETPAEPAPTEPPEAPEPAQPTSIPARPGVLPRVDTGRPLPAGVTGPVVPSEPPPLAPPGQIADLLCGILPVCPTG